MAFLEFVKSGKKTYVYVSEYVGKKQYTSKKEERIIALGPLEKAHMKLKVWQFDRNEIPESIKSTYHNSIPKWIDAVVKRGAF